MIKTQGLGFRYPTHHRSLKQRTQSLAREQNQERCAAQPFSRQLRISQRHWPRRYKRPAWHSGPGMSAV